MTILATMLLLHRKIPTTLFFFAASRVLVVGLLVQGCKKSEIMVDFQPDTKRL